MFNWVVAFFPYFHLWCATGKNINETLTVLSKELEIEWREFLKMLERVRVSRASCQARLDTILGQGDEMRIVLFSQRGENIFAMAYACDRIQSVYNTYVKEKYPYQEWIQLNKDIIARYQRLEDSLNRIPSFCVGMKWSLTPSLSQTGIWW